MEKVKYIIIFIVCRHLKVADRTTLLESTELTGEIRKAVLNDIEQYFECCLHEGVKDYQTFKDPVKVSEIIEKVCEWQVMRILPLQIKWVGLTH